MATVTKELNEALKPYLEIYQPIFGHETLGMKPIRNCVDRLDGVKKVYDALSKKINRPLRVLDLGCNLGFFSFNIAKWGGVVTAIDFSEKNIGVCKILEREHPDYKIKFEVANIEEFLSNVKKDEYDLVLCLAILHHISKKFGIKFCQDMVLDLSKKIHTGIFEFATESVHAAYVPKNYRDLMQGFDVIRILSYNEHIDNSGYKRPMCFVSNKYLYFEELGILQIDRIGYNVLHTEYLEKTDLMYYFCGDKFVKFFNAKNKELLGDANTEVQFLSTFGGQNDLPKLRDIHIERDENGIRIFIVRDHINGITLKEKINKSEDFDRWDIIKQVLEWLVLFEKRGFYHGDIEPSNFIFGDDGKIYPIDYEEIRPVPIVRIWPFKVNLLFFYFMNSILAPNNIPRGFDFHRQVRLLTELKKYIPPKKYQQILLIKDSEKYFARLYEILFETETEDTAEDYNLAELETLAVEKYLDEVGQKLKLYQNHFEKLAFFINQQQQRIEQLERIIKEKLK